MKRTDLLSMVVSFLVTFVVVLGLSTWGPLSDDASIGRRLIMSLVVAVAVSLVLTWLDGRQRQKPVPEVVLDDPTAARVDELLAANKKVAAVKAVRDATGADLKSAVSTVEARERGAGVASAERP